MRDAECGKKLDNQPGAYDIRLEEQDRGSKGNSISGNNKGRKRIQDPTKPINVPNGLPRRNGAKQHPPIIRFKASHHRPYQIKHR